MDVNDMVLEVPRLDMTIRPGNRVRLGRFDHNVWIVGFGWYSFGGNRPICGWYLTLESNPKTVKSLQLPDLDDIYMVEL